MKIKKESIPLIATILFLILSIVGIGSGVYFYRQYKASEEKLKNPAEAAKLESKELVAKVGRLMLLPNEEAQVVIVIDVETLKKTQPFFQDAKDNDKLLLFPNAKKAVLYREAANVIVNVAPIIDQQNQATLSGQLPSTEVQGQSIKIALRNGSGIVGITQKLEEELKTKMQNITIVEKDNAKRMDYEKTVVIVFSDTLSKTFVQQLANELSASVSALPFDEPKPAADLLIIAGKDRK
ncbi:LytR C-terminal domain-containing protein [Patescibacteria group bacterium]|nr:LytR C-terminal domain-containing protein [Patescibacteria group bacterium]